MKSKKITKKLNLNKKTVADLSLGELKNANGGFGLTIDRTNCLACSYTCVSCGPTGEDVCPCPFPPF
jgi:hypothetical protein